MPRARCIAIVDDDPSVRDATGSLIRSLGHAVRTFGSAADFLESTALDPVDCLITDVQMDPVGGIELAQRLRDTGSTLPVIFMTAFPDERIRERTLSAGAAGFFAKPFDGQALIECVERAIAADRLDG